ncbi:bone morphogenetic protein 10-like [Pristis pectinata]|uniref:bone morphogenetic protein 10-like n=1 Tax=Pristis pectinata TaxID=685728 RepID=UPI00223D5F46|nr:bone morphogenetic protein 10-like [Pristis pectinata]
MTYVTCLAITVALNFLLQVTTCKPLNGWDQSTDEDGLENYENEVFPEDDSGFDFNAFLESVKDEFFRSLNLSEIPLQDPLQEDPPQYMIDLYNKFATDRSSMPSSNIVRSFRNEDTTTVLAMGDQGTRRYILVFNLTIPQHEEIIAAELRLYAFVDRDRRMYEGVNRIVRVYDIEEPGETSREISMQPQLSLLVSKQIVGKNSGWETFDVTDAVKRWVSSYKTTHKLEVHIESAEEGDAGAVVLDNQLSPENKNEPLLVVFSDDQRHGQGDEMKEMLVHEQEVALQELAERSGSRPRVKAQPKLSLDSSSRTRRNAKGNYCKRSPLHVDFTEIGWNSWIIAPKSYEAYECRGVCYIPLSDHVTPTNHARIQTLVNHWNPEKAAKACCVPTKLDPISILYKNNAGVTTYKYKYEGMVVAECGCR